MTLTNKHRSLWVSRGGKYVTSWQHTKYVGWILPEDISPEPELPTWSNPYSIIWYMPFNRYNTYERTALKSVTLNNNGTDLTYYIIDGSTPNFRPEMDWANKSGGIYHIKPIDGYEYITMGNPANPAIKGNATWLPLVRIGAIACISDYMSGSPNYTNLYADIEKYRQYIRIENEKITNIHYTQDPQGLCYAMGFEYKTTDNSFFNQIFETPSIVLEGKLKYDGFNYHDSDFVIPIKDKIDKADVVKNNKAVTFTNPGTNWTGLGIDYRLPVIKPSSWSNTEEFGWYPKAFNFDNSSNTAVTNVSYPWGDKVALNPYLPAGGATNTYEYQTIYYLDRGSFYGGRLFHAITRYWWCPSETPE